MQIKIDDIKRNQFLPTTSGRPLTFSAELESTFPHASEKAVGRLKQKGNHLIIQIFDYSKGFDLY